ncbi:MAG: hypothetical protein ACOX6P_04770 [Candidatus Merdivicinus sp.]|jgi:hypothetical protein
MLYFKNDQEKPLFYQMMERMDQSYDPKECSLTQWRGEHGYHSTLVNQTVHGTRDSLSYAYELLNRDGEGDRQRSMDILNRIVPLQDTDPSHKTYGIWSYYTEEPLTQMAPPDWNWADFCGKEIMHILLDHPDKLSAEMTAMLRESLLHACNSIRIRDMGPGYTNISIMGTYVTLVGGTLLGDDSLIQYAKKRLRTLYQFNISKGSYNEYNSPTYTLVLADDLARMLKYVKDSEDLKLVEDLNDLAWKTVAEHYHFKTKQWAGPHARAYTMLQTQALQLKIQRALDYRIHLVDLDQDGVADLLPMDFFSLNHRCPAKYVPYFTEPRGETEVNQRIFESDIATAYMTNNYTIGNFYQCTFWNQKRNMLCYFGDEKNPAYCGLKLLHDLYDYSSGVIVTAQQKNRCVSLINFITDGGDTHCNLDMVKNATITASDLRIRFEFGGAVSDMTLTEKEPGLYLAQKGDLKIRILIPYAKFGDMPISIQTGVEKDHVNETGGHSVKGTIQYLDIILYHGEKREINFAQLQECVCALAFEITDSTLSTPDISVERLKNDNISASYGNLRVCGSVHAVPTKTFYDTFTAWIDGKEYRDIF